MQRLSARERELTGEPITPETSTTDPIAATDGRTTVGISDNSVISSADSDTTAESGGITSSPASDSEPVPTDPLHPDVKGFEAGQVLVLKRRENTVCVWPTTPDADEPYVLREYTDKDEQRTETPISNSELFDRL